MKSRQGFELKNLAGLAIVFVVVAIVISFGATIVDDLQDEVDDGLNETAYNTTISGLDALQTFADWLPTLALIVVAAVIIGIIVRYFAFSGAV